jgi:hypothetical protein
VISCFDFLFLHVENFFQGNYIFTFNIPNSSLLEIFLEIQRALSSAWHPRSSHQLSIKIFQKFSCIHFLNIKSSSPRNSNIFQARENNFSFFILSSLKKLFFQARENNFSFLVSGPVVQNHTVFDVALFKLLKTLIVPDKEDRDCWCCYCK